MTKKKKLYLIIIGCGLIGLILLFGSKFKENDVNESTFSFEAYTYYLEDKIESFLLSVEGISNVKVIVTVDDSGEKLFANQGTILSDYSSGGTIVSEVYPSIRGVAIACTNGDNDVIKAKITKLISAYLGISANRIEIVCFG